MPEDTSKLNDTMAVPFMLLIRPVGADYEAVLCIDMGGAGLGFSPLSAPVHVPKADIGNAGTLAFEAAIVGLRAAFEASKSAKKDTTEGIFSFTQAGGKA